MRGTVLRLLRKQVLRDDFQKSCNFGRVPFTAGTPCSRLGRLPQRTGQRNERFCRTFAFPSPYLSVWPSLGRDEPEVPCVWGTTSIRFENWAGTSVGNRKQTESPIVYVRGAFPSGGWLMKIRTFAVSATLFLTASLSYPASASTASFNFAGPGVSGTVQLTFGSATDTTYPQAFEVTGISGTFSDSN